MSATPIEPISAVSSSVAPETATAAKPPSQVPRDATQLSPLAQIVATLEALRSSDPTKYAQITQKVAAVLDSNSQIARSQGDASAAGQLAQLSVDFSAASITGHLGGLLQDLSEAISWPAATGRGVLAVIETSVSHSAQIAALDSVAILVQTESSL